MDSAFAGRKLPSPPRRLLSGPRLPFYRHSVNARVKGAQKCDQKPRSQETEKPRNHWTSREAEKPRSTKQTEKPRSREVQNCEV